MELYKNIDLSREYNVSAVTVLNWIESSVINKNTLQLHNTGRKYKIIQNDHNIAELTRLSEAASVYKNANTLKVCKADNKLYELFTQDQLLEIVTDINRHNLFQHKYTYVVADYWDKFVVANHAVASTANDTLLNIVLPVIKYHLENNSDIDIIDFGCGNGMSSRGLITKINEIFSLNEYISIDISDQMNLLCQSNIKKWFPNIKSSYRTLDFERDSLNNVILTSKNPCLLTLSGGTMPNLENSEIALKNISRSMKDEDLFAINFSLDNIVSRSVLQYANNSLSNEHHFWFFGMLGIDVEKCSTELMYIDSGYRQKSLVMDKDYKIELDFNGLIKTIHLRKGQKIAAWRHRLITEKVFIDILDKAGLKMYNLTFDKNGWSALAICKTKQRLQ